MVFGTYTAAFRTPYNILGHSQPDSKNTKTKAITVTELLFLKAKKKAH